MPTSTRITSRTGKSEELRGGVDDRQLQQEGKPDQRCDRPEHFRQVLSKESKHDLSFRALQCCRNFRESFLAVTAKPDSHDFEAIARHTLGEYDRVAESFWRGTRDHDVRQNIEALLRHIEGTPPYTILDFGCGPGRDLKAFRELGHDPIGLEGSPAFAAMARAHSGCEVWEQSFLALDLPQARFDGIFANASLFHVPTQALPQVLAALHATLKPGGVLFSSNPRGRNEEGWNQGRYGAYWDLDTWRGHCQAAGFVELEHYYRPGGIPVEQRPWLATVWRAVP